MQALIQLQAELESNQLQVILVPLNPMMRGYNEGGCKRVAISKNPTWYSRLCARFPSSRGTRRGKPDTILRRKNVLTLLRTLIHKGHSRSKYAPEILAVARKMA